MWSSSVTTKLSHSRSGSRSTAPRSLRRTVRRSSESSAYVFGEVHRPWRLARRAVQEAPAVRSRGDVGDDVELLADVVERLLEREVVSSSSRSAGAARPAPAGAAAATRGSGAPGPARRQPRSARAARRRAARRPSSSSRTGTRRRGRVGRRAGSRTRWRGVARAPRSRPARAPGRRARPERPWRSRLRDRPRHWWSRHRGRALLPQDLVLELLQPPARLDAELVDEPASRVLVGLQRLGLAPSGVEREHQLRARGLPAAGGRR